MGTTKQPFCAEQFTTTKWDSAQDKAQWANAMASWVQRGFPTNGWRKGLYEALHTHMFGHIAHFNQYGFYEEWFANIHRQLQWLQYVAQGGAFGMAGDPAYTWCDVERAWSAWVRESGLIARYQQLCAEDIEAKERAVLAHLSAKYEQGHEQPVETALSISLAPMHADEVSHAAVRKKRKEPQPARYVRLSLFEEA